MKIKVLFCFIFYEQFNHIANGKYGMLITSTNNLLWIQAKTASQVSHPFFPALISNCLFCVSPFCFAVCLSTAVYWVILPPTAICCHSLASISQMPRSPKILAIFPLKLQHAFSSRVMCQGWQDLHSKLLVASSVGTCWGEQFATNSGGSFVCTAGPNNFFNGSLPNWIY